MTNQNIAHSEQLVPVFNAKIGGIEVAACDARALHAYLEVGKVFSAWLKNRIDKYGFIENKDYTQVIDSGAFQNVKAPKSTSYGTEKTDYHLALDMAKELAMVERNAKGREVRRYFIECERRLHEQVVLPSIRQTGEYPVQGLPQDYYSNLLVIAKAAQASSDAAQTLANAVSALVDKYASHATSAPAPNSLTCPHIVDCEQRTQPQLLKPTASTLAISSPAPPCADSIFLSVLRESLESQPFPASQLHLIIVARQYPALTDAAVNLLGDVTTWSARKLGQTLGRWSRSELSCHRVLNLGASKNGIVWRLERVS